MAIVSEEAANLNRAMQESPVAYAYFDAQDRLRHWNSAYAELNIRIRPLIREGASFIDLLAELILNGQIDVPIAERSRWIEERLEARRLGHTAFRHISDGRVFLVQERRDRLGGTLGFWLDVTDLFNAGAFISGKPTVESNIGSVAEDAVQDVIRNQLQVVLGALELLADTALSPERALLISEGRRAIQEITGCLDELRVDACPPAPRYCPDGGSLTWTQTGR